MSVHIFNKNYNLISILFSIISTISIFILTPKGYKNLLNFEIKSFAKYSIAKTTCTAYNLKDYAFRF